MAGKKEKSTLAPEKNGVHCWTLGVRLMYEKKYRRRGEGCTTPLREGRASGAAAYQSGHEVDDNLCRKKRNGLLKKQGRPSKGTHSTENWVQSERRSCRFMVKQKTDKAQHDPSKK